MGRHEHLCRARVLHELITIMSLSDRFCTGQHIESITSFVRLRLLDRRLDDLRVSLYDKGDRRADECSGHVGRHVNVVGVWILWTSLQWFPSISYFANPQCTLSVSSHRSIGLLGGSPSAPCSIAHHCDLWVDRAGSLVGASIGRWCWFILNLILLSSFMFNFSYADVTLFDLLPFLCLKLW